MDAAHYARVRELFLAAVELPPQEQAAFLRIQAEGDPELYQEILSLLAEHDPESARLEGERATAMPAVRRGNPASSRRKSTRSKTSGQTTERGDAHSSGQATQENQPPSSQITQLGALRTHASPRYDDPPLPRSAPRALLWDQHTRRSRRANSRWLWLAALLPTALIGWITFSQVRSSIHDSVRHELTVLADTIALASDQFIADKSLMVQSWARQPAIRDALMELAESAPPSLASASPNAASPNAVSQSDLIRTQLQKLSGSDDLRFVVWNDSYKVVASWRQDRADLGTSVHHENAADLARVLRGETVLYGPRWPREDFLRDESDPGQPILAIIVPIKNEQDQVVFALLVQGPQWFTEFSDIFAEVAEAGDWDAYAIDGQGVMLTQSVHAGSLAREQALDV
ncbi:MAG: cache domain-containing protein, partial [Pirellulales bacterium]|nr:cache domain-containing protein [Pirellulales bacterium]